MWGKVVTYCGKSSDWAARYAIQQRGDGPLLMHTGGPGPVTPRLFVSLTDVVEFARDDGWEYLIMDELINYARPTRI